MIKRRMELKSPAIVTLIRMNIKQRKSKGGLQKIRQNLISVIEMVNIEILRNVVYNKIMEEERFFKVYANLPLNLRGEIILVLPDRGPITWQVAYLEINGRTKLGEEIFKKLIELKII